jgi:type IV secretory pathway VirB10-like protein
MAGFDLKRPSAVSEWKKTAAWTAGAALVAASIGGGVWYFKGKPEVKPKQRIELAKGFDADFFAPPPEPVKVEPKAAPAPAPEPETKVPELVPIKPKAKAEPPPEVRPTARQLFAPIQPTAPAPVNPAIAMNEARRGSGLLRVSYTAPQATINDPLANTQAEWFESKTEATYPVNMERVIPVTRRIAAVVIEAINSELEGKVTAQIEENIYGQHGRKILVPAGSMAVGRYKPLTKAGESRISVIWSRIITPDGINITVGNAEMADAMGRSGITGDVDSRFFDRYGMALLVSTLSAVTAYNIPVQSQGQAIVIQTYGNNLAQLSNQILEKNINIKPIVTIPPGSRILISPTKDIWFKKPEQKQVEVVAYSEPKGASK